MIKLLKIIMPILKIDILGSEIKINYEESEKEKLLKIISQFKKRLNEFPQHEKISDKLIILFSALKIEDELEENKKLLLNKKVDKSKISEQFQIISKLNDEIILLKNEINELQSINKNNSNNNLLILEKVNNLEKLIDLIKNKIKDELG